MPRVMLDTGPLGRITHPLGNPEALLLLGV
jgi:hypothetical protein